MKRFHTLTAAALLALAGSTAALADNAAMLAQSVERPEADVARDADRKPAETIAFAGVKPGDTVVELLPGRGYYSRLLSEAVGPEGRLIMVMQPQNVEKPERMAAFKALAEELPNAEMLVVDLAEMTLDEPADLVWTTENYHDLHHGGPEKVAAVNAAMLGVLKPGGIYFVEDHSAPGTGLGAIDTIHRIDPLQVVQDVTGAGFRFDAMSNHLFNPDDPHNIGPFDESIRGKTDRFAIRFRKPAE